MSIAIFEYWKLFLWLTQISFACKSHFQSVFRVHFSSLVFSFSKSKPLLIYHIWFVILLSFSNLFSFLFLSFISFFSILFYCCSFFFALALDPLLPGSPPNRYNIVFLAFTYGIPMVVMIICYSVMGRELWGSQSIGENTERQTESVKSKKKVSKEHLLYEYCIHPCSRSMFFFFVGIFIRIFVHCVSKLVRPFRVRYVYERKWEKMPL